MVFNSELEANDFNPRSPCGERPRRGNADAGRNGAFQSTLPVWGATAYVPAPLGFEVFQSTLPVWGATRIPLSAVFRGRISIHAPRVGSDDKALLERVVIPISIHAPRVGSDRPKGYVSPPSVEFQSTLPVWGATRPAFQQMIADAFQSTLPVWGATLQLRITGGVKNISIHAPRVGSDDRQTDQARKEAISIHAPRVGSDP